MDGEQRLVNRELQTLPLGTRIRLTNGLTATLVALTFTSATVKNDPGQPPDRRANGRGEVEIAPAAEVDLVEGVRAVARPLLAGMYRGVPLGVYIVDFACLDGRLVVELDGGQHNEEVEIERDARRTAWLESQGFRVVRFWNFQVIEEIEEVIETIWLALSESTPHPNPPPQGGREILGPWRRETLG